MPVTPETEPWTPLIEAGRVPDGRAPQPAALLPQVDEDVVGERRHEQAAQVVQGHPRIQRRPEQLSRTRAQLLVLVEQVAGARGAVRCGGREPLETYAVRRVLGSEACHAREHPSLRLAVRAGVWLRPFRDLIYTMPPYVTGDEDLALICRGVLAAVDAT